MDIWHISNKDMPSIRLWRRKDGLFQVAEDGIYTPILDNGNYILINKRYQQVFGELTDQVTFKDAIILDIQFKTKSKGYLEMDVSNKIDTDSINSEDGSGFKVWRYDGSLFVSRRLKKLIVAVSGEKLQFSLGFQRFG